MSLQETDPNSNGSPEETLVGRDYLQRDGQDERTQEGVLETPEAANSSLSPPTLQSPLPVARPDWSQLARAPIDLFHRGQPPEAQSRSKKGRPSIRRDKQRITA